MLVRDVMTAPVVTVEPSTSIREAAKLMLNHGISGLPVVDSQGRVVGIVSEGDFLRRGELGTERKRPRWLKFFISPGRIAEDYVLSHGRAVGEVMTENVRSTSPEATIDEIVDVMSRNHIKRLPVVRDGALVGIVSRSDLLRALSGALAAETVQPVTDEAIRELILAEFRRQTWTGPDLFRVSVRDGVVELEGAVFDGRERAAARVVAENVAGVKSVTDRLIWIEPTSGILVEAPGA